jgi:hypothetical protein
VSEKLETGAMLNPRCQECSKKDTCNNKTLCAYLIPPKEIKINRVDADLQERLSAEIILTPEMIQKQINKKLINKSLEIGVDLGFGESKQAYFK